VGVHDRPSRTATARPPSGASERGGIVLNREAGGASAARAAGGSTTSPRSCPADRGDGRYAARRSGRSEKWSRQPFAEGGCERRRPRSPRGGPRWIRLGGARTGRLQFWISTRAALRGAGSRAHQTPTVRPKGEPARSRSGRSDRPMAEALSRLEQVALGDQPPRRQARELGALRGHVRLVGVARIDRELPEVAARPLPGNGEHPLEAQYPG
jgi:hypothetical protein